MIKIFFDIGYPLVVHLLSGGSVLYQYYSMPTIPARVDDFAHTSAGVRDIAACNIYDA
jgi:hypothetical protein